jgi:hypothetical protein
MPGYRKVPQIIHDLIASNDGDHFYVGRTRSLDLSDLQAGRFAHLGIQSDGVSVTFDEAVLPDPTNGRWSKYNTEGREVIRKDLPKYSKNIGGWTVPNFGDYSRGSRVVSIDVDVYPREIWYGKGFRILIDAADPEAGKVKIAFRVDRVFDRNDVDDKDLLLACSFLRENVRSDASIVSTNTSVADWLDAQRVEWEFLPVGTTGPREFSDIAKRLGVPPTHPHYGRMHERYDVVASMKPVEIIVGVGEFSRYFGFKFADDLVALESLDYGNALYVMYEDWQTLGQRTRVDLLADASANYDRVIHSGAWEDRLRHLLAVRRH